ncbi:MAG TPA: hypothetical protein VGR22_08470 [Thermomicrobiales bacterium]|nr:hypothetical protein [Thermomicrobiales bacterium]
MPSDHTAPAWYQERIDRLTAEHTEVQGRWSLLANVRLVLFVILGVAIWQWWAGGSILAAVIALATAVVLVPLIAFHRRLRGERDRIDRLIRVNTLARQRAALAWEADLPHTPLPATPPGHPYARDLNMIGEESLLRRIGTPVTVMGWRILQSWLLSPASPEAILERQPAVRELGEDIDLRHEVEQTGIGEELDLDALEELLTWAEAPRLLAARRWLLALAWIGPLTLATLALAHAFGIIAAPLWVLALAFNLIVTQFLAGDVAVEVDRVGCVSGSLRGYQHIVDRLEEHRPRAPLLRSIHQSLFGGDGNGAGSIRRLTRATAFVIPRGSLLYIPLQMAFAWDLHVAGALDHWKATSGGRLRGWSGTLGEWEALAALGVLVWDHPDWAMPMVDPDDNALRAENLRHPLLPVDIAVGNDVVIGPAGTFLFVTGSNMSGKSTLLRAAGANAVLAQAGGPVAAAAMALPPVDIVTTMRVEDSLAHGVSFFLAELQRLKQVIDAADSARERPVLYLLDEILQGTNTLERQIASRRVLHHLTETTAIGAVSSHDLTLIEGSGLEERAVPVHFSEQFREDSDRPQMTFDYRLRPGLATSSNALKLMQMLGFPEM